MGAEDRPAVARRDGREPGRAAEVAVDLDDLAALLGDVLTAEGIPATAEASLQLVDSDEIAALNAEHMGSAGPTDVLSFPLDGADGPDDAASAGPSADRDWIVGDVVVCPEVAAAQAADHAGSVADELALLVTHGGLHLCGWDHAEPAERDRMWARERELLTALGRTPARDPWEGAG